ncbi:MAG: RNA pseudouridine synthase [Bacteroidetes bacterium CG02_land_8_20_14_3_00_31_25]|nr:RluA family pseudouridine synthase [Bacteroidota bacterium]PIV57551.1 MAG: RNA pseudouridine synthase [Bacteroidetes bacterium CG02_land_8_20_14_3_00_31_25]PIY04451.1 MAG: RNA pseudouridine synthase [Bacteroidetes bacterium CG_4_10_14_3_um_filter_31_20]
MASELIKPKQLRFVVDETATLIKFLRKQFPNKGSNKIKQLIERKLVTVNNETTTYFTQQLQIKQIVAVNEQPKQEDIVFSKIKILFEDESIIVIDKKAGLLSIATQKEIEKTAYSLLSEYVKRKNQRSRIFIVHRLDKQTSGVMIFAKNQDVKIKLQQNWHEMIIERTYSVVVEGFVEQKEGTIISWLKENKMYKMYSVKTPDNDSRKAITHYKVEKQNNEYSLLTIRLETGRKNQIRVHFFDLGFPVVGDVKYGATHNPIKRLGLHAKLIKFMHPVTNKVIRFESPIPSEFLRLVQ